LRLVCGSNNVAEWRRNAVPWLIHSGYDGSNDYVIANATVKDSDLYRCYDAVTTSAIVVYNVTVIDDYFDPEMMYMWCCLFFL